MEKTVLDRIRFNRLNIWGYRDENKFQSNVGKAVGDLSAFFASVDYDGTTLSFYNTNGEKKGSVEISGGGDPSELKASAFTNVEYDDGSHQIKFYNMEGAQVGSIDASDFIIDGMVDDVKIENGNLVITFNTESGKETIELSLEDIFNPSNYYNKTEVDDLVTNLQNADATLQSNIDAEATARQEADALKANKADLDVVSGAVDTLVTELEGKADKDVVYTKDEVDAIVAELTQRIDELERVLQTTQEVTSRALNDLNERIGD